MLTWKEGRKHKCNYVIYPDETPYCAAYGSFEIVPNSEYVVVVKELKEDDIIIYSSPKEDEENYNFFVSTQLDLDKKEIKFIASDLYNMDLIYENIRNLQSK